MIDRIYFSINQKSHREFFKTFSFSRVQHYFKLFKSFSLSIRSVKDSKLIFCHFPSNFLQGFCLLRPVRPFYPSFVIYFHVSCIFGKILNLWDFGVFGVFNDFFQNWSMGFYCWMILTRSLWLIWWIGNNWNL